MIIYIEKDIKVHLENSQKIGVLMMLGKKLFINGK